jgi:cytoskeletal protein RodZ
MPMDSSNKSSVLKNTREAKGLTLEIVHEATKIPLDALKSIEEGYSTRILSPFYYRGFIKIYSEFLGLDVAQMYKEYGLDEPHKSTSVVTSPTPKSNRQESKPNQFLEKLQDALSLIFKPKNLKVIAQIIGIILAIFLIVKLFGFIGSHWHKKAPLKKHSVLTTYNTQETPDADTQEAVAPPPPVVKHEVVEAQAQNNQVEVAVRAPRDIWLRVKADDKTVFETTLSKGSMETWTANDRIELSGRDLERLDMEVNGKHIGTLGAGERRVRRIDITKEGLTVKK